MVPDHISSLPGAEIAMCTPLTPCGTTSSQSDYMHMVLPDEREANVSTGRGASYLA